MLLASMFKEKMSFESNLMAWIFHFVPSLQIHLGKTSPCWNPLDCALIFDIAPGVVFGRDGRIRTCGLSVPNAAL